MPKPKYDPFLHKTREDDTVAIAGILERLEDLEAIDVKAYWYEQITSGTSGTVSPPQGSSIVLDQWAEGVDALASEQGADGRPNWETPTEADGTLVTAALDEDGNWTLSGTPSSYPVTIIYAYSINLPDLDITETLGGFEFSVADNADCTRTITKVTGTYTALVSDDIIHCTGTWTLTLYPVAGNSGKDLTIKNAGAGAITVDGNAAEIIEGAANRIIAAGNSITIYTDGIAWFII